jgi:glutamate carboxypeptidase
MMTDFLSHFQAQHGAMVWTLSGLIEAETPTADKGAVDALGDWMVTWAKDLGAEVVIHEQSAVGNMIECRWNASVPGKALVICCHMDTVHPLGSVDTRPTHTEGERLYGVGSYDMKAGITVAQTVIEQLHKLSQFPARPVTLFLNTDEEIGSPHSRSVIEAMANDIGLMLVMEPGPGENKIVTERKGVGIFRMVTMGRSAHSGSNPDQGVNAIVEMSHQVQKVCELSDQELGTTVIPTIIAGGTAHNVIPDECDITINARARFRREADRVTEALLGMRENVLDDALVFVTGGFIRPPMEHNEVMIQTVQALKQIVPLEVMDIEEFSKGGGSDGNFTAALGVPTLDGLGPTGGGAHSEDEFVYLPSLSRRAALLAHILVDWPLIPEDESVPIRASSDSQG